MANPFDIDDIDDALKHRRFPTATVWNRLEGRPRTLKFERSLQAEVRDALWMLTRQWQLGEFRSNDAGSPALAKMHLTTTRLTKYRPSDHATEPFEQEIPLEAKVERRPIFLTRGGRKIALDVRLLMGRQWLKLIAGLGAYAQVFIVRYPIELPDPTIKDNADICAHPEVWQDVAAVAGRCMDGGSLYLYLKENSIHRVYDGIQVAEGDKGALDSCAARFIAWFERLFYQPPVSSDDAWIPSRLAYQFSCSAPDYAGEKVLLADEYFHGHLDWYNFTIDQTSSGLGATPGAEIGGLPAANTQTLIPAPVVFDGMPNTRWWAFEDRKTNLGNVDANTTDLGKLLLMEFALIFANDWFLIPCTLPAGSLATVRGLVVTNVFGERLWIDAAGRGPENAWQRWSMFTVSRKGSSGEAADTALLLLPTITKSQESAPVEEITLLRDEVANMVWGVEKTISLVNGMSKPGAEAAVEIANFYKKIPKPLGVESPSSLERRAQIRYQVTPTVPEHWIPFIPVHVEGETREIQLQRAALPRILEGDLPRPKIHPPRTMLLHEGLDSVPPRPYFLHEEEVPLAGIRLTQSFQRTRGRNGRVLVWLGVRKHVGRGVGSSGLAFDQLVTIS